jgi:catechol 2,3-dioxygenase-like lactoylglutathione lyase family enzyme
MTSKSVARRISPMLATDNVEETIRFYHDVLGFTPTVKSDNYSSSEMDNPSIFRKLRPMM